MNTIKAIGLILLVSFICVVIFILVLIFGGVLNHNWNLYLLQKNSKILEHPLQTQLLNRFAEIRNYTDGTYCNYTIGEFRKSNLTHKKILDFYSSSTVESFDYKRLPVEIYFLDDEKYFDDFRNPLKEWFEKSKLQASSSDIYLVYVSADGYPTDYDYRCE